MNTMLCRIGTALFAVWCIAGDKWYVNIVDCRLHGGTLLLLMSTLCVVGILMFVVPLRLHHCEAPNEATDSRKLAAVGYRWGCLTDC